MKNKTKNIAIIGAGASGLIAAIVAAREGAAVTVYEKNSKIGRKLLATGNGRCNITNRDLTLTHFHGKNPLFAIPALKQFDYHKCYNFFNELGIELIEKENGRLYPMSLQASSVVDMLIYETKRVGVKFKINTDITDIEKINNGFLLKTANHNDLYLKLLIATGSPAMPSLGSCDSGYDFAKSFGHTIIQPLPSLVQLISSAPYLKKVSGVKFNGHIKVLINKQNQCSTYGDILFTNYGVSGSAILDVSRPISTALANKNSVEVILDLMPLFSKEKLITLLQKRVKFANNKTIALYLEGLINKKLTTVIIEEANLPANINQANQLGRKDLTKIAYTIKNIKLKIIDTKGFKSCEVAAGGIDTTEIDQNTMQSKLQNGLFFSGEVLDIDRDCGGYNLQWAWASGYVAGKSLSKPLV